MLKNLKQFNLAEVEEKVLKFWEERGIFERSVSEEVTSCKPKVPNFEGLEVRKEETELKPEWGNIPAMALRAGSRFVKGLARKTGLNVLESREKKKFIFYEGPPTANGRPGLHHILTRSFKDAILRYKTMRGYAAPRRAGWDTHGLPVELQVEKELGFKSKKDIENFGIAEFNQKCKESVWRYKEEWERLTRRIGFWLDMKRPYVTYEAGYIEGLWSIVKEAHKNGLLYKGHKVVPWCPRCGTGLSSHELAQGYKEVEDTSVYVKFKLEPGQKIGNFVTDDKTYVLAWTTTPWTLPGNVALAVGENIKYQVHIVKGATEGMRNFFTSGEYFIFAKGLFHDIIRLFDDVDGDLVLYDPQYVFGHDLIGLKYEPLFNIPALRNEKSHRIYGADFVNTDEGTGVVHTAVMYGEDDYELGKEAGLPQHHTVDEDGKFTAEIPSGLAGLRVKDKETEAKIFQYLEGRGFLLRTEKFKHEYPHCWRCDTPLIYYARDSWFFAMSRLREKMIAENGGVNWIPSHIKDGRFGEWLKEAKDWAISRERFWGTPLPVWICGKCGKTEVVDGREELSGRAGKSKNEYILMRHGEAVSNVKEIVSAVKEGAEAYPLTLKGRVKIEKNAALLKKEGWKPDLIFASDFLRARETAGILSETLGAEVVFDERLREVNLGVFEGKKNSEYHRAFSGRLVDKFKTPSPGGETLSELAERVFDFIKYLERDYSGKRIIVISHEAPLLILYAIMGGLSEEEVRRMREEDRGDWFETGEARRAIFLRVPREKRGFADLHRPFVDDFVFSCQECGGEARKAPEVMDVWFDSGAMPFAAEPRSNQQPATKNQQSKDYPADFICEAVDQTRGWFYTLLAVSVLMGEEAPYKNAICLGHLLDGKGQKMSKSRGNAVDPWEMTEKYGADVLRWHLYTINPPGEPKRFEEADLGRVSRQVFMILYNSFVFYDTYAGAIANRQPLIVNKGGNILDRWILARFNEVADEATNELEKYEIGRAARAIERFIDDLSRWYIRRSRKRFQRPEDGKDFEAAAGTLRFVLLGVAKLIAPFAPFFAEALYLSLERGDGKTRRWNLAESVHLKEWPKSEKKTVDAELIQGMAEIRRLAALGLTKRAEAGIRVRQTLAKLKIKDDGLMIKEREELLEVLAEEVNVKSVVFDGNIKDEAELDTRLTPELLEEGITRELIRTIQDLRQDAGLKSRDEIALVFSSDEGLRRIVEANEVEIKKSAATRILEYGRSEKFDAELETKIDGRAVWMGIRKL